MHWVWATNLEGAKILINLAAAIQMAWIQQQNPQQPMPHTNILWPAVVPVQGGAITASVQVRETIDELFKLPRINANVAGLTAIDGGKVG